MAVDIYAILAPPQTLDTLDTWGTLDSLPWSLDSAVWRRAGVYRLEGAEAGRVFESLRGENRIRTESSLSAVSASGTAKGDVIFDIVARGFAYSGEDVIGGVARAIPIGPLSSESADALWLFRVRPDEAAGQAASRLALDPFRVRLGYPAEVAVSEGSAVLYRIMPLLADSVAESADALWPSYKGWDWEEEERSSSPVWTEKRGSPGRWSPIQKTSLSWTPARSCEQAWRRKEKEVVAWR